MCLILLVEMKKRKLRNSRNSSKKPSAGMAMKSPLGLETIPDRNNKISSLISKHAVRAVLNIQKEYSQKKINLEAEMTQLITSLKKEKQALADERQALENEKKKSREEAEKLKNEILRAKNELRAKVQAEEQSRIEQLLREKEETLIEREKNYLENLIKHLESDI